MENELIVKVRKGAKVKIVEDDNMGDRDIKLNLPKTLKIEVNRMEADKLGNSASKITMCG
ncbi:MAG: hypothetical protein JWQ66_1633 [Mucilaginibacter sp.]|nr:hypothetical protein [Mucilaginibacter sp.]